MKKFIRKISTFAILSAIISSFFSLNLVSAAKLSAPYGTQLSECISEAEQKGSQLIHIIEEPILQPSGSATTDSNGRVCFSQDGNPDFKTCICYRNNFSYLKNGDRDNLPELLTTCSKSAIELYEKHNATKDPETDARFSCQEVQVLFCSGGTCLITSYIGMIYRWAATIVGLVAVIVIIVSSIQLSVAGGDSSAVESAKRRILQSIGGLAVLFLSGLILNAINPDFFVR